MIHSLWKPPARSLQGLRRDAGRTCTSRLHTTVIGLEGKPLEIQIRTTAEMHRLAEYRIAAHVAYKAAAAPIPPAKMTAAAAGPVDLPTRDPTEFHGR